VYLKGSGQKYYLVVLRDRYSRRCAIDVLKSRETQGITNFLVSAWQWLGLPQSLQMDNALEFRGSNRYPRSFSRLVRVAVNLNIEPVFIPVHEPWRNGCVERHNRFLEERLLTIECADFGALQQEAHHCQKACNQTHRLEALDGLTPNEVVAHASLRLLSDKYTQHQQRVLPQDKGSVCFVRLVRKSGRITLGAQDRFMVDPDLAYTYVLAKVDLTKSIVTISHNNEIVRSYDYSPDTIGAWAEDEQKNTSDLK
jgi:hypothetical protein